MRVPTHVIYDWKLDTLTPGVLRCVFYAGESKAALVFNQFDSKWLSGFINGIPVDDWEYSLEQNRMVCKGHVSTFLFHPDDFWRFFDEVRAWFVNEGTLSA